MNSNRSNTSASTEGMVDYDRNSHMQDHMVRSKSELLRETVSRIGTVAPEFVVADYGCGPGHSALDTVRPVIEACRRLDKEVPIVVRHVDQPGNDWNALLALVFGPEGYQASFSGIRTETAIGSFYSQMAAPGSVALATCFAASHWLSRSIPLRSPHTIWFADLEGEARTEFVARARADWTQFLRVRAAELRTGGYAVVSTLGSVPDPSERNGIRASGSRFYRVIHEIARTMVDDDLLAERALEQFVFAFWFPTAAETVAPVEEEPDLAEVFEIVEASVEPASIHGRDVFEDEIGNPATYARQYAGFLRAFGESSLRKHLFAHSADDTAGIDALTAEFFRRFETWYRNEPGRHAYETMIMTLVLRRR